MAKTIKAFRGPTWVVNGADLLVTSKAAEDFIDEIQDARQSGYGFVPLIGAGFSAPSGAPLIHELKSYLERCVCMALGSHDAKMEPWEPRTDQWPPFIDRNHPVPSIGWLKTVENAEEKAKEERSRELPVISEGRGAMAEWRTALLFLSRLVRDPRGTSSDKRRETARLYTPDQAIIDSCFRAVLEGKHPALCHRMLAVLAGALRLDVLLTTNFDDLLERAFAATRNPLEVVEVHVPGNLPHWSALSDVRSLIKLHGSRHALRADYSLDEPPSEQDKRRFLEYLITRESRGWLTDRGRNLWREAHDEEENLTLQNHLLVMGNSGADGRIRGLIEHAWIKLPSLKVFWLCYSDDDVRSIKNLTDSFANRSGKNVPDWNGSVVLRHTDFGLFLLQLYQVLRKNLPPLGSVFPSVSRLTLPPLALVKIPRSEFYTSIVNTLEKHQSEHFSGTRLVVATSAEETRGVTSVCIAIFQELEPKNVCLWLDLNDISSADNLFEVLLEAAYYRIGLDNWTPVYMTSDPRRRGEEFIRLVKSVNKPWIIFLNARETPGANSEGDELSPDLPNGWLDKEAKHDRVSGRRIRIESSEDQSACVQEFCKLLLELCANESGISVVLLCRNKTTPKRIGDKGAKEDTTPTVIKSIKNLTGVNPITIPDATKMGFMEIETVVKAIEWTASHSTKGANPDNETRQKRRFLHALLLMQRPRLLSTIWCPATLDADATQSTDATKRRLWVTELEDCGLVRRKAGGFIWIHSRIRQLLRQVLNKPEKRAAHRINRQHFKAWNIAKERTEIHANLADWYSKVLDASEAPAAVFETVYHLCQAALAHLHESSKTSIESAGIHIEAAAAVLKRNSFLIQTHGYSRGSCRKLEDIRDKYCIELSKVSNRDERTNNLVQKLRIVCTETMRAVAREVGEDAKAYLRHRQFAIQIGTGKWNDTLRIKCNTKTDKGYSRYVYDGLCSDKTPYIAKPQAEWLRWWRWSGMLAIASRSFEQGEHALLTALSYATNHLDRYCIEDKPWKQKVKLLLLLSGDFNIPNMGPTQTRSQGNQIEILRTIEQYVELMLLKANAGRRVAELSWKPFADQTLPRIESFISYGRQLATLIRGVDHSPDAHHTAATNWCESRLLMHASVCAARRVQLEFTAKDKKSQTPMGLLGDAEASLRISDAGRHRLELAMIELHRAEVRLREAESVPIPRIAKRKSVNFITMCSLLEDETLNTQWQRTEWKKQGEDIRIKFFGDVKDKKEKVKIEKVRDSLRRANSLVLDATRFLRRAEPVLRERRRNVWWTTWFFERRLRAISLSIWASVFEGSGAPIPYLGLEAAMRDTDTDADILLEDSMRMIRSDAYRLATIVEAYCSCALGLQMRLMLDDQSIALPRRQETMSNKITLAVERLKAVQAIRTGKAPREPGKSIEFGGPIEFEAPMDPDVAHYVEIVIDECTKKAAKIRTLFRREH